MGETDPTESRAMALSGPVGMPAVPAARVPRRRKRQLRGKPLWVIAQTGYRARDGSAYGYGTSSIGPTRKLMAVCRSEAGVDKWLGRLNRWAAEDGDLSKLIPTYETMHVTGVMALAGPEPALCVGPEYYGTHGPEASLRAIVLSVRESHTALRREVQRRRSLNGGV